MNRAKCAVVEAMERRTLLSAPPTMLPGEVQTPLGNRSDMFESAYVTAAPDTPGIVAVGVVDVNPFPKPTSEWAVFRYNSDGTLDTAFNNSTGMILGLPGVSYAQATCVREEPNGDILVGGFAAKSISGIQGIATEFALARYTSAGIPDTSFGNNGVVLMSLGSPVDQVTSLLINSDGSILVAGETRKNNQNDLAIVKFDSAGQQIMPFGGNSNGIDIISGFGPEYGGGLDEVPAEPNVPAGEFYVIGFGGPSSGVAIARGFTFVQRHYADGTIDANFGVAGQAKIKPVGSLGNTPIGAKIDSTGIEFAIDSYRSPSRARIVLAKLTPGGQPDLSFSPSNGEVVSGIYPAAAGKTVKAIPAGVSFNADGSIFTYGYAATTVNSNRGTMVFAAGDTTTNADGQLTAINFSDVIDTPVYYTTRFGDVGTENGDTIFVGFQTLPKHTRVLALLAIKSDGTPDANFGTAG